MDDAARRATGKRGDDPGGGSLARRIDQYGFRHGRGPHTCKEKRPVETAGKKADAIRVTEVGGIGPRGFNGRGIEVDPHDLRRLAAGGQREEPVSAVEIQQGPAGERAEEGAGVVCHRLQHGSVDL